VSHRLHTLPPASTPCRKSHPPHPHTQPHCSALTAGALAYLATTTTIAAAAAAGTTTTTTAKGFSLAPRSNTSDLGAGDPCGETVNWPGTTLMNNAWSYQPYDCSGYWSYNYVINVTGSPFAYSQLGSKFQVSNVTLSNIGSCAGFTYSVTMTSASLNEKLEMCSGTIEPSDPAVTCNLYTVPGQWVYPGDYVATINIDNKNWVCNAEGNIVITQDCTNGSPAGADLCTHGVIYGYQATQSSPSLLGYVTGGCVSNITPGANCAGGASFCCPNGAYPSTTSNCATTESPCYDCTGGC